MKDCIYTSGQHADTETQIQAKFFNKLTLNAYRKAIANRYGFKSYKLFKEALDKANTKTIYVVAYENLGSSGGYDYFHTKANALVDFENEKEMALELGQQLFFFEVTLPKDEDIDSYLEHNYTGLSDKAEMMFPYPKEVWNEILDSYNKKEEINTLSIDSRFKILSLLKKTKEMISNKNIFNNTKDSEAKESLDSSIEEFIQLYLNTSHIDERIVKNVTSQEVYVNQLDFLSNLQDSIKDN